MGYVSEVKKLKSIELKRALVVGDYANSVFDKLHLANESPGWAVGNPHIRQVNTYLFHYEKDCYFALVDMDSNKVIHVKQLTGIGVN